MPEQRWFEQDDAELRELSARGWSCRRIAERLNKTRNSVIGRMFRIGLSVKKPPASPEVVRERQLTARDRWLKWEAKVGFRNGGAVMKAIQAHTGRSTRRVEAQKMMRGAIVCCESPKLIWDLTWCDCRWIVSPDNAPLSETYFCANIVEPNSSYCAAHSKMAHDGRLPGQGFVKRPGVAPNWMTIRSGRRAA